MSSDAAVALAAPAAARVAVRVAAVSKRYGMPLGARRAGWALRDITFEVRKGETLGLIGRNGAGKSTLLKLLAGVTPPTEGHVHIDGRVFPMIELNAGTHPELTGRENVRLLGAIMGLDRGAVSAKMPAIEDFCELGRWFDQPIRKYSSGMIARLGFGVALNTDADILLVDEVLSVGDLVFQKKCLEHLETMARDKTILFVSHSIRQIQRFCDRVLLLEDGRQMYCGPAPKGVNIYEHLVAQKVSATVASKLAGQQATSGEVAIEGVDVLDDSGNPTQSFHTGDPVTVRVRYHARQTLETPIVGIFFVSSDQMVVAGMTTEGCSYPGVLSGRGEFSLRVRSIPFLPGSYSVKLRIVSEHGRIAYSGHELGFFQIALDDLDASNVQPAGVVRIDGAWG